MLNYSIYLLQIIVLYKYIPIELVDIMYYFEGFDANMKTQRSKQFKFFEKVLNDLK